MAINGKPLKLEQAKVIAKDYNEKINKKVDAVEGSQLVETTDVQKLKGLENIKEVQVNGQKLTVGDDGIVNIDVEGVITGDNLVSDTELGEKLGEYTKTESLKDDPGIAGKFLDKETASSTYATLEQVGNLGDLKGSCLKAELEDKKAECKANDMYIVTDDDNHIFYYTGEEWVDTNAKAHVDLTPYLKSADATNQFVAKDGDKVLVDPATVTQVDTNKSAISELQTTVSGLEGSLKPEDIEFATDQEVLAQLQAGAKEAQGQAE